MAGVAAIYIVTPGAETRAELVAAGVAAAKAASVPHIVVVSVLSVEAEKDILFKRQCAIIEVRGLCNVLCDFLLVSII
jgi:uncharacterized protein YbjT (DUF2867 family)